MCWCGVGVGLWGRVLVWHKTQDAYKLRTFGLIIGFRGLKSSSIFGDSCFFLGFGTSYIALFNGLMISDVRILVLHVYCL